MSELHQYDSRGEDQQIQDSWQRELARIYAYLEPKIPPDDRALVLRAFGLDEKPRKERWAEMTCTCGDE